MDHNLQQTWENLCSRFTDDQALVAALWNELHQNYTSDNRHYHTLGHLAYMFELAEKYSSALVDDTLLSFAIFYHDSIYNATRSDNEIKSAALAAKRLESLGLPPDAIACVSEMILATKLHQPHHNETLQLLLNLDLAILGADWPRYDSYRKAVRSEYSLYPALLYNQGRKKVLQHFLHQPNIYKTSVFRAQFEQQARQNLQQELALLG